MLNDTLVSTINAVLVEKNGQIDLRSGRCQKSLRNEILIYFAELRVIVTFNRFYGVFKV